jgi:hypothetical protein
MKKKIIRKIVMVIAFIAAVIGFGFTTNQANEDLTTTMAAATLPTISFYYRDVEMNELHGYVDEMDMTKMRDSILPIADDREVTLVVNSYGNKIEQVSYEIRSMDGQRLVADAVLDDMEQTGNLVSSSFEIQNLLEAEQEYLMVISVDDGSRTIYYYTRIMQTTDCHVDECLQFAMTFHDYTFRDDAGDFIPTYMDPATGDATTLNYVDLTCTLKQITWADFEGTVLGDVMVSFKEINDSYNVLVLRYMMTSLNEQGESEYYNIEEYYRLRETETRMYVLNFERTMNQIFHQENSFLTDSNRIQLGIRDTDVEYRINEAGDVIAFVQEGELWCYNASTNELAQVYSFRSIEGIDNRENWREHDIKIVRLDEAGSVDFIVYGYMNRGDHEGEVGIGVYHYDGISHTVEEEIFIPVNQSYEVLRAELGQLLFENDRDELYLMMNGDVYCISLGAQTARKVVSELKDGCYAISSSGRYLAWVESGEQYTSTSISLMDLTDGSVYEIAGGKDDYLRPLHFIDNDFVYGVVKKESLTMDAAGNVESPMYALKIMNTSEDTHDIIKTYEPGDTYVSDISIDEHTIDVSLVKEVDGQYVPAGEDAIMNREADTDEKAAVTTTATDIKETQVQIALSKTLKTGKTKRITFQTLLTEEEHILTLDTDTEKDRFYVYVKGEVRLATDSISEAILLANKQLGIVVDARQQYIWMRAHKTNCPAFTGIAPYDTDADAGPIVQCVSAMLMREDSGISVEELVDAGQTPKEVLENTLKDAMVLDLTGCTAEEIIYYVSNGSPVFAMTGADSAVLVIGYSSTHLYYYNPESGKKESVSMEDAAEWFQNAGNIFFSYLKK